eukprot:168615_1
MTSITKSSQKSSETADMFILSSFHKVAALRNAVGEIGFRPPESQDWSEYIRQFSIVCSDLDTLHESILKRPDPSTTSHDKPPSGRAISDRLSFKPLVKDFKPQFFLGTTQQEEERKEISGFPEAFRRREGDQMPEQAHLKERIDQYNMMCSRLGNLLEDFEEESDERSPMEIS